MIKFCSEFFDNLMWIASSRHIYSVGNSSLILDDIKTKLSVVAACGKRRL